MTKEPGDCQRHFRTLFSVGTVAGLSDGQLLERFTTCSGESAEMAFAALVERHGAMVLRVCRRVLVDPHDAQDAFQATFLVLVRRAGSVREGDSLASWLHGVAYRTASCARSAVARRKRHERKAAESAALVSGSGKDERDDLVVVIHEELERMPGRYRGVIILCDLEGHTHDEAARLLSLPVGTIKSRLARGRKQLRDGLCRRGVVPSAAVGRPSLFAAAPPSALVECTIRSAMQCGAISRRGVAGIGCISFGMKLELFSPMGLVADIGSNDSEHWFWFKTKTPGVVYYRNHNETGANSISAVFHSDWIFEAMGLKVISEDEAATITVEPGEAGSLVLTQGPCFNGGAKYTRVTIIDGATNRVREHQMRTGDRTLILARAIMPEGYINVTDRLGSGDGEVTVFLPKKLQLRWPQERLDIEVSIGEVRLNKPFTASMREILFAEPQFRKESHRVNLSSGTGSEEMRRALIGP